MKNLFLTIATLFFLLNSNANSITAKSNGLWNSSSTWSKNSGPSNGDSVIIPQGIGVQINTNINTSSTYYIQLYGTLDFTKSGSKLSISDSSTIYIYDKGSINGTSSSSETIIIGSNEVYNAGKIQNVVVGASYANSTTPGFVGFIPLPVKFIGFSLAFTNNQDVLIQWSTAEEINSATYEVERSYDGNNWNTIAYVLGAGNSNNVNNYSYTDKNASEKIIYYRIKQIDTNGQFTYTAIKSIRNQHIQTNAEVIKIASYENKVILQFPIEIKGNVLIRFVSLSGQVIGQQIINQPVGQIVLNPNSSLHGDYIVSVSNGQSIQVAKQVIL